MNNQFYVNEQGLCWIETVYHNGMLYRKYHYIKGILEKDKLFFS